MLQRALFPKGSSKYVWGSKTSIESIKTVLFVTFLVKIPNSFIYSSALWGIKQQWLYIWTGNWIDSKWRSWRLRWDGDDLVWRRCWKYRTSQFPGKFSSEERVPFEKLKGSKPWTTPSKANVASFIVDWNESLLKSLQLIKLSVGHVLQVWVWIRT